MAKLMYIETPRGFVKQTKTKNGVITTELKWNPGFAPKLNASHISASSLLGIVKCCVHRTSLLPVVTSMLVKSGILGTKPGDGEVAWIAPYAWYQYHLENRKTSQNVNPNGGPYWFERAWSVYGPAIKRGVENKIKRGL